MNTYQETQARQDAEANLRSRIAYWVDENLSHGISAKPNVTYRIIFNEEPELFEAVGRSRVFPLCRELHAFEDHDKSSECTMLFDDFNQKYFGGSLPQYRARVVTDIFFWIASQDDVLLNLVDLGAESINLVDPFAPYYYSADGLQPSRIDLLGKQIVCPHMKTECTSRSVNSFTIWHAPRQEQLPIATSPGIWK
jgi:hypothetical protein